MAQKSDSEVSTDIEVRENDTSLQKVRAQENDSPVVSPFAGQPPSDSATPKNLTPFKESSSRHQIVTSVSQPFNTDIDIHTPSPDKEKILYSDASSSGWGGHLNGQAKSGRWSKNEKKLNIQQRELLAIYKLLDSDLSDLQENGKLLLKTDNTSVVDAINNANNGNWTRHKSLESICENLFALANHMHIEIKAEYIPEEDNAVADQLSRSQLIFPSEWSLDKDTFQSILKFWKIKPSIDLFASAINNKHLNYVSKYKDPKAYATDAFSFSWYNIIAYAFPPAKCFSKTIEKIKNDNCIVVLVANRKAQPHIEQLLLDAPLQLGHKENFLIQPGKKFRTTQDLCAFKLFGFKENRKRILKGVQSRQNFFKRLVDGNDKEVVPTEDNDQWEKNNYQPAFLDVTCFENTFLINGIYTQPYTDNMETRYILQ